MARPLGASTPSDLYANRPVSEDRVDLGVFYSKWPPFHWHRTPNVAMSLPNERKQFMKKIVCPVLMVVVFCAVMMAQEIPSGSRTLAQAVVYDYTELYKKISPSVFKIEVDGGHGSGFLVDSRGLIATNHHVVGNTRFLAVKFSNSITIPAEILVLSARYDIAIIKVHESYTQELKPLDLVSGSNEQSVEPGLPVVAFGSPLSFSFLATQGIVSKVEENSLIGDFLIEPGNSGGPLVNLQGRSYRDQYVRS